MKKMICCDTFVIVMMVTLLLCVPLFSDLEFNLSEMSAIVSLEFNLETSEV